MPYPPLDREEYIEQAYFFRTFRERLQENHSTQDILASIHEEVLSTTKLPMALEFLRGEILLNGKLGEGMQRLPHYFTPFQAFVFGKAEEEKSKFDQYTALNILEREAEYRSGTPTASGLFIFQFECVSRNRLGYDRGLLAMQDDPLYDELWRRWIQRVRMQLGTVDFSDLIYYSSEQYLVDQRRQKHDPELELKATLLFGAKEGRIARANRGKDPLYMFAALQRQLGYPAVPRIPRRSKEDELSPAALNARLVMLEKKVSLMDAEMNGNLQLDQLYAKAKELPPVDDDPGESPPPSNGHGTPFDIPPA